MCATTMASMRGTRFPFWLSTITLISEYQHTPVDVCNFSALLFDDIRWQRVLLGKHDSYAIDEKLTIRSSRASQLRKQCVRRGISVSVYTWTQKTEWFNFQWNSSKHQSYTAAPKSWEMKEKNLRKMYSPFIFHMSADGHRGIWDNIFFNRKTYFFYLDFLFSFAFCWIFLVNELSFLALKKDMNRIQDNPNTLIASVLEQFTSICVSRL